ncbi:MAG: hypothetical protein FOGNACKC_04569 [Anaerolineae bacterium]|nr:hypothetical protein [Anaerolineae bacterium]
MGPFVFDRQQYEAELGKLLGDEKYHDALFYWADWLVGDRVRDVQDKVVVWAS